LMMKNEHVKAGLLLAGIKDKPDYQQGFNLAVVNTKTNEYDMMRHPDREVYELNYVISTAGNTQFTITDNSNTIISDTTINASLGENTWSFNTSKIINGKQYILKMKTPDNKEFQLVTRLR